MHILAAEWPLAVTWALLAGKMLHLGLLPLALQLPFSQHLVVQTVALAASLVGVSWDCAHIMGQDGHFQVGQMLVPLAEVHPPCTGTV